MTSGGHRHQACHRRAIVGRQSHHFRLGCGTVRADGDPYLADIGDAGDPGLGSLDDPLPGRRDGDAPAQRARGARTRIEEVEAVRVEEAQVPVVLPEADGRVDPCDREPEEGVLEGPLAGSGGRGRERRPVAREEPRVATGREQYDLEGDGSNGGGEEADAEGARPSTSPARVQASKRAAHQERDQEGEDDELGPRAQGKTVEELVVDRRQTEQHGQQEEVHARHQDRRLQPCPTAFIVTSPIARWPAMT